MEINKKNSAMAVSSLVLGIIGILSSFFWYMALPTNILAIVFGAKATRKYASKLGKTGLILGIIGISLFVFIHLSIMILLMVANY